MSFAPTVRRVRCGCAWTRASGHSRTGKYTLRREAAVYRALAATPVQVATLVAVHPTDEAFLMERLEGRNWFAEVTDPNEQLALASAFMGQVAELHRLDPRDLALPELGVPDCVSRHVVDEIDIWDEQYRRQGEPEPLVVLALSWLRRHPSTRRRLAGRARAGRHRAGQLHVRNGQLVAVTDWEMAHWGDLHDDLAWIYVRDLQERFTHMPIACATTRSERTASRSGSAALLPGARANALRHRHAQRRARSRSSRRDREPADLQLHAHCGCWSRRSPTRPACSS
jgi:aminoglycoside phosphotransferase (APT) family kinase protein